MADRKHLFGTSEKSDFILNMTDEGTKKLCAVYCIIAMAIIELAAIPYYLTKNVVDYTEEIGGVSFPHYLSDKVIYFVIVIMFGLGILGLSIFLIGRMKKQISLADNRALAVLGLIIVMSLISALASGSLSDSMTGYLDRAEGFLTLIGYYGFFAAAFTVVGDGWRRRLCTVIVTIGVVNAVIGILQTIPAFEDILPNWFSKLNVTFTTAMSIPAANGLAMTPHALAALLTIAFAAAFAGLLYSNGNARLAYGGAGMLMAIAGVLTRTVTAWVGIGSAAVIGCITAVVYAKKNKSENSSGSRNTVIAAVCALVLVCGAMGGTLAAQVSAYPESDGYKVFCDEEVIRTDSIRMLMLLQKQDSDEWVYTYLWDDGMFVAEQSPLLGIGPDNWEAASSYGLTIDRTYNEYVDTAMQRGFVTLALYVIFLLITVVRGVKAVGAFIRGEVGWAAPAVMTAVTAYAIQAFFNISSLESTPFFFICAGLIWSYGAVRKTAGK